MAVCETETVHKDYGIFLQYQPVYCPSEYSANIFKRQFGGDWRVLRHFSPIPKIMPPLARKEYIFYTIGNVLDYRKNIKMLLEAFLRLNLPDAYLVLKATLCPDQTVPWKLPKVIVNHNLLTDEELDEFHRQCDCYINCSFSEGVGMGAVEAAIRNKPVIITDYGGLHEYVNTPYVVSTKPCKVGREDFLFQPEMTWGQPSLEELMKYMYECYTLRLREFDHEHTRLINDEVASTLSSLGIASRT